MLASRGIVVMGFILAVIKLFLIRLHDAVFAEFLALLTDLALAALVAAAAWLAARRSVGYARALWWCVGFAALFWIIQFGGAAWVLETGIVKTPSDVPLPALILTAFPFAAAFLVPLFLSEDRKKLTIEWPQRLDIAQLGILVFSAFLVFVYIPFLHVPTEAARVRYLMSLHFMRDGFLAGGYLYRGWHSALPDLRRLHIRISGFLATYGIAPILAHVVTGRHWPDLLAGFLMDFPALFLLVVAVSWRQERTQPLAVVQTSHNRTTLWTQLLALAIPLTVVALSTRVPNHYLRIAWIPVTASFVLYAVRLFLMQQQQGRTLSSLRESEERFATAFRSSPAAITIARLSNGTLIDVNDRALQLFGLPREQVVGKTTVELGAFESAEHRERLVETLLQQGFVRGLPLNFRSAGRTVNTLVSAEVIQFRGEALVIASTMDVTELNALTQQLQQAQKMELISSVAGGIAHDFNNLLTIITNHCSLALTAAPTAELTENVVRIKEATGKAARLIQQLLAFSRRQVLQSQNVSLNSVVASIEDLLRRTMGSKILLATSYAPDLGIVLANPVQMEQVVMNLAVNARDAMPRGGTLSFETKNLDITLACAKQATDIPEGRYVMLAVTDTGTGILPENIGRIFEPFFTTKPVGTGTGLGLSTVYAIVRQSGGHIRVSSDPDEGTSFKVYLPRVDAPPAAIQPLKRA